MYSPKRNRHRAFADAPDVVIADYMAPVAPSAITLARMNLASSQRTSLRDASTPIHRFPPPPPKNP